MLLATQGGYFHTSELEAERLAERGEHPEHDANRPAGGDLVRVLAEKHRRVNRRTRILRRQSFELALGDQFVHVTEERLGPSRRPNSGDDRGRLLAALPKRVHCAGGHGDALPGAEGGPCPVLDNVEATVEHL